MTAVKMRLKLCVLYWVPLELAFPISLMSILALNFLVLLQSEVRVSC